MPSRIIKDYVTSKMSGYVDCKQKDVTEKKTQHEANLKQTMIGKILQSWKMRTTWRWNVHMPYLEFVSLLAFIVAANMETQMLRFI